MTIEIPPHVREAAARLGPGVPYALKVMAGQLADDPDMGRPSKLPDVFTVTVDGDLFEDCPALDIGYLCEPDRIEIRYVTPVSFAEPAAEAQGRKEEQVRERIADPATAAVLAREVADAWGRFTCRLRDTAADSYAAICPGATLAAIAALESDLGVRLPLELTVLWLLAAGDDGVNGRGCLPGNGALMPLDAVAAVHRMKMDAQAHEDVHNTDRPEYERVTVWKKTWIPVVASGAADRTAGLYLDSATGYLTRWSRYGEGPGEELDTLVTYLEEAADMLESPALATRDKPGLIGSTLVWLSSLGPLEKDRWQSLAG